MSGRTVLQVLLAGCVALLLAVRPAAAQEGVLERAIKATYLYKFAPFVEWPTTAFESPQSPFVICVIGDDPFADVLGNAVAGQRISGRPIAIRRLSAPNRSGCQILFAVGSQTPSALAAVRGAPVLTVTDSEENARTKGIINFVIRDNHVRFQIDNAAAAANGLVISSKLLSLAVDVTPKS